MREIVVKAALVKDIYTVEEFYVTVSKENYMKVRFKIEQERKKIINILKEYRDSGVIKSIWRPKYKPMQKSLDKIVRIKKDLKKSITQIKEFYCKG